MYWSLDCSILRFGWGCSLHFLRFYLRILSIRHRSDHRTWTCPNSSCWWCLCRDFWGTVVWGPRGRFNRGGPWGSGWPLKSTLCIPVSWVLYSLLHYILKDLIHCCYFFLGSWGSIAWNLEIIMGCFKDYKCTGNLIHASKFNLRFSIKEWHNKNVYFYNCLKIKWSCISTSLRYSYKDNLDLIVYSVYSTKI